MKRAQDSNDSPSPSRGEKFAKLGEDDSLGLLDLLPDDEFKLVLEHLDVKAKGNLKQTSKDYEKRIMRLDPSMRSWKVCFDEINYEYDACILSNARIRHSMDGTIQSIKLSVRFKSSEMKNCYRMIPLADSVINHWKDNIIFLDIILSGLEFFLLDPELKIPNLKSLVISQLKSENEDENEPNLEDLYPNLEDDCPPFLMPRTETSRIIAALMEKVNIEKLTLININCLIPCSGLQLKELTVINYMFCDNIIPLLKASQSTLKKFHCSKLKFVHSDQVSRLDNLKLNFKELTVNYIDSQLLRTLIKCSQHSLTHLELEAIPIKDSNLDLEDIHLKLTDFSAIKIPSQIINAVIRLSQSSLKNLSVKNCLLHNYNESFCHDEKLLKLKSISAMGISPVYLSFLLHSAGSSLEELSLKFIHEYSEDEYVNKLNLLKLQKLKKFSALYTYSRLSSAIIDSSRSSLEILELNGSFVNNNEIRLQHDKLQLKKFVGVDIDQIDVDTVFRSSFSTLKHLQLTRIHINTIHLNNFLIGVHKLGLKTFSSTDMPDFLTAQIIKCAHESLEHLQLKAVRGDNARCFKLSQVIPNIKSFTGISIPVSIVSSVLNSLPTVMNSIVLKEVRCEGMNIYQLDSKTTNLLNQVQERNPFCCLDILKRL